MARDIRKMRLTEAHLALLHAKIDDQRALPQDGFGQRPDSYFTSTTAALMNLIGFAGR